jgi:hypothetical protein
MVRVNGPAFSLGASGSIGGALVFSSWKGRPYIRELVTPHNPKSVAQTSVRAMFKFLAHDFASLDAADKATWDAAAKILNASSFNAYMRDNMNRWTNFYTPSKRSPPALTIGPTTVALVCTPGPHITDMELTPVTTVNQYGYVICRSTVTGFTPSLSNVIAVERLTGDAADYVVDTPIPAATYYYRAAVFTNDGVVGAFCAQVTSVVPT